MRAVAIDGFGQTPAVSEQPAPEAGPGQVLVRVQHSSINGFDLAVHSGLIKDLMPHEFPVTLGRDFAGTVEALGEGSSRFDVGARVFGVLFTPSVHDGSFAELVALDEQAGVTGVPDGVDLATAGALGLAGCAAHDCLAAVALQPGQTVLVTGATGGVGSIVVQYAAAAGAHVIATATPGAETDFVLGLGAEHVVDYRGDVAAQVAAISPEPIPAIVHLAGDPSPLKAVLAPDGRLATTIAFVPDPDPRTVPIYAQLLPATLDQLAADVAAGRLRLPVERSYPLDEVPAALDQFRSGTMGKIAIDVA